MHYHHVQTSPLHWILVAASLLECGLGLLLPIPFTAKVVLVVGAVLTVALAASIRWLSVSGDDHALTIAFGPLALFRKTIEYSEILSASAGRSGWIDGWGIHYVPGKGWIWNIWGRDCVVLERPKGPFRIGTDDPQGLAEFLNAQVAASRGDRAP